MPEDDVIGYGIMTIIPDPYKKRTGMYEDKQAFP